jgi:DNA repair protein RecO (recombination protein O)
MNLFEYKDYSTMNEADSLEQFWGMKSDIELLALCSYFAEVTEAVAEEGRAQPELLSLILNSIYVLDKLQKPKQLVKAAFELRLMCLAGYEPLLDACAVCGAETPERPRLNLADGVLHCAGCRDGTGEGVSLPLPATALGALRYIACGDPRRLFSFELDVASLASLGAVTEAFLLTQLDRPFRTLDFYKGLSSMPKE